MFRWPLRRADRSSQLDNPKPEATVPETPQRVEAYAPLFDVIEGDLRTILGDIRGANGEVAASISDANSALTTVSEQVLALVATSRGVTDNTAALSQATLEMSDAAREIGAHMEAANATVASTAQSMEAVSSRVSALAESSYKIDAVLGLIADIARQTNLLALNATIEAARAGEAGKGFAVVAQEVKLLATRTQAATADIGRQIDALRQEATGAVRAVQDVRAVVDRVAPMFNAVAAAVEEQNATIAHVAETARSTAAHAANVDASTQTIASEVANASKVTVAADLSGKAVDKLSTRLMVILRENSLANRRKFDRYPLEVDASVTGPQGFRGMRTIDMSEGGAWLTVPEAFQSVRQGPLTITFAGIGEIGCNVVDAQDGQWRVHFESIPTDVADRLQHRLQSLQQEYAPLVVRAQRVADAIAQTLSSALQQGRLTEEVLFDTDYRPVAGSDPQQFLTRSLSILEDILPNIQEPVLKEDHRLTFCVATDRNGYLPVHNAAYSQPQRKGDPVWNAANCRNRRIFDDRAGFAAARNVRPFLIQTYSRDMGNGTLVMMREIDAPILVVGRHWGGIRMAYRVSG